MSLLFLSVDRLPGRRSGVKNNKVMDGRVKAQKQLQCSFLLEVMSATFNLLTTLFGILAHVQWTFWRVCVLCRICKMSSRSLRRSAVKVLGWIQWSRLFTITIAACVRSLLLGISPSGGVGSYCSCWAPLLWAAVAAFSHQVTSKERKKKKHSSSSSLFFVKKLVREPGQVNLLWVDF